jgi:hypothetical protein
MTSSSAAVSGVINHDRLSTEAPIMVSPSSRIVLASGLILLFGLLAVGPAGAQESTSAAPPAAVEAPPPNPSGGFSADKLYFGGGFGLSLGTVDYVEISPLAGYRITPAATVGASLLYRYRNDDRYDEGITTNDYGGAVFGDYRVLPPIFLHAELEYLSYEYVDFDASTDRDDYTSVYVGGGVSWPAGRSTSLFVLGLYNLSYSDGDPGPYSSPWVVRVGVGFGM